MWMWIFVLVFAVPLAVLTAYVVIRDKRHPVDHPPKGGPQGWGNVWPR